MSVRTKSSNAGGCANRFAQALLLSTAIAGVGGVHAAYAQGGPATAANQSTTGLQEVVVTARKRDEDLQTVPVSATVVSAPQLLQQNLVNLYDLRGAIPDLNLGLAQGGSGINLSIRGVGAAGALVQNDPKIGLYLDDMFVARPEGNSLYFYDQAGIQVLYGPQGTLFGRNTAGGAFVVTTNRPTNNPNSSYAQVTFGNYNTINTEGAINVPITDTLLTRFSFRTEKSDGYITHLLDAGTSDNINDQSFRGQVRWIPTPQFTADLLYEHDVSNTNGSGVTTYQGCTNAGAPQSGYNTINATPYCSLFTPLANKYEVYGGALFQGPTSTLIAQGTPATGMPLVGGDYNPNGLTQYYRGGPFSHVDADTLNLHLNYELNPNNSIKSVSTYRHSRERDFSTLVDAPVDPYEQYDDQHTTALSEDLNLTGKAWDSRLQYTFGFYYYDQTSPSLQFDGTDYCDPAGWNDYEVDHEKSYAGYGQASFDVTSQLELTVGGRYTHDLKTAVGSITAWDEASSLPNCNTYAQAFTGGVGKCANNLTATGSNSWSNFNPMASVLYKFTPGFNVYATVRTAYDEGGFNAHSLSTKLTNQPSILGANYAETGILQGFNPDHFVDYEGGIKTEWFDHTLRVNVDVYYQKYEDLVSTVVVTINGIQTRNSQNAGDAHYDGIEGALEWQPIKDLYFSANGSLIRAKYDTINPAAISTTFNLETPLVGTGGSPKSIYALNGSYTLHPNDTALLTLSLNYKHQGSTLACQVGANYTCSVPAYGLLGGRATFQLSPDSPWTVSAFVTNLANSYWLYNRATINTVTPGMGIASDTPGAPREYGLTVKRTF